MSKEAQLFDLTRKLIQINTENPPGNEAPLTVFVKEWLQHAGIVSWLMPVVYDRHNLIVKIAGMGDRPMVLLAHADTVPAGSGWQVEPFAAEMREGKIFGRGACDMKGSLAALLMALAQFRLEGRVPGREVFFCLTVDEETVSMSGANALANSGIIPARSMVVAVEPTDFRLCVKHKGAVWYRLETYGKAAHAGVADQGADAVYAMSLILASLKNQVAMLPFNDQHLGKASISIGRIEGGGKTNVVSDFCLAEADFRLVPPMSVDIADDLVRRSIYESLQHVPGVSARYEVLGSMRPPVAAGVETDVEHLFAGVHGRVFGEKLIRDGFRGYTDAALFSILTGNDQCMVYGPGRLELAHSSNEYIAQEDLIKGMLFFQALLNEL